MILEYQCVYGFVISDCVLFAAVISASTDELVLSNNQIHKRALPANSRPLRRRSPNGRSRPKGRRRTNTTTITPLEPEEYYYYYEYEDDYPNDDTTAMTVGAKSAASQLNSVFAVAGLLSCWILEWLLQYNSAELFKLLLLQPVRFERLDVLFCWAPPMPNTRRRRRRNSTRRLEFNIGGLHRVNADETTQQMSLVGVGGVCWSWTRN